MGRRVGMVNGVPGVAEKAWERYNGPSEELMESEGADKRDEKLRLLQQVVDYCREIDPRRDLREEARLWLDEERWIIEKESQLEQDIAWEMGMAVLWRYGQESKRDEGQRREDGGASKYDGALIQGKKGKAPKMKKGKQNKKANALIQHTWETLAFFTDAGVKPPLTLWKVPETLEKLEAELEAYKEFKRKEAIENGEEWEGEKTPEMCTKDKESTVVTCTKCQRK